MYISCASWTLLVGFIPGIHWVLRDDSQYASKSVIVTLMVLLGGAS